MKSNEKLISNEKVGKRVIIVLFGIILLLFVTIFLSYALINYRHNRDNIDPSEFHNNATIGFIRSYIEPSEDDDMHLYLVLSDRAKANAFEIIALPKNVYDTFDDELKAIIDSRETGCLLSLSTLYNEIEFSNLGYSYIENVNRYQLNATGGDGLSVRLYNER